MAMERRKSLWQGVAARRSSIVYQMGGPAALRARKSIAGSESSHGKKPNVNYENTYQLEPKEEEEFVAYKVESVINNILKNNIQEKGYVKGETPSLAKKLANAIKQECKDMGFPRHKFVVNIMIGEDKDQGMQTVSRCVWNEKTDNFATGSYRNKHIFCIATVHAVYFE